MTSDQFVSTYVGLPNGEKLAKVEHKRKTCVDLCPLLTSPFSQGLIYMTSVLEVRICRSWISVISDRVPG